MIKFHSRCSRKGDLSLSLKEKEKESMNNTNANNKTHLHLWVDNAWKHGTPLVITEHQNCVNFFLNKVVTT